MAQVNSAMPSRSCKVLSGFPQQNPSEKGFVRNVDLTVYFYLGENRSLALSHKFCVLREAWIA